MSHFRFQDKNLRIRLQKGSTFSSTRPAGPHWGY